MVGGHNFEVRELGGGISNEAGLPIPPSCLPSATPVPNEPLSRPPSCFHLEF